MSSRDNLVVDWCCVGVANDVDGIFKHAPNFQNVIVVIIVVVAVGAIAAVQDQFHFQFDLQ